MGITCDELAEVFCNKSYVIVICNYEFGTSIMGMDEPEVNIDEDFIYFRDVNDTSFKVKKCCIVGIDISEQDFSCNVKIELGNGKMTLIICE